MRCGATPDLWAKSFLIDCIPGTRRRSSAISCVARWTGGRLKALQKGGKGTREKGEGTSPTEPRVRVRRRLDRRTAGATTRRPSTARAAAYGRAWMTDVRRPIDRRTTDRRSRADAWRAI